MKGFCMPGVMSSGMDGGGKVAMVSEFLKEGLSEDIQNVNHQRDFISECFLSAIDEIDLDEPASGDLQKSGKTLEDLKSKEDLLVKTTIPD